MASRSQEKSLFLLPQRGWSMSHWQQQGTVLLLLSSITADKTMMPRGASNLEWQN